MGRFQWTFALAAAAVAACASAVPEAAGQESGQEAGQGTAKKPNILVIWGDDIGTWNVSHNNRGMMGWRTPSIDRIAAEGVAFTDYYGQQSCTAGRAPIASCQAFTAFHSSGLWCCRCHWIHGHTMMSAIV